MSSHISKENKVLYRIAEADTVPLIIITGEKFSDSEAIQPQYKPDRQNVSEPRQ